MEAYTVSLLIIALGAGLLLLGTRFRTRLPQGKLVYIDDASLEATTKTLYDPARALAGRPDFVFRKRGILIPVEAKSSQAPHQPHHGHMLQLAAYCHLVEATTGRRPPYGLLRYRDRSFRIAYSESLRRSLFETLEQIQHQGDRPPDRSHSFPQRCLACGYQSSCDQVLT